MENAGRRDRGGHFGEALWQRRDAPSVDRSHASSLALAHRTIRAANSITLEALASRSAGSNPYESI